MTKEKKAAHASKREPRESKALLAAKTPSRYSCGSDPWNKRGNDWVHEPVMYRDVDSVGGQERQQQETDEAQAEILG